VAVSEEAVEVIRRANAAFNAGDVRLCSRCLILRSSLSIICLYRMWHKPLAAPVRCEPFSTPRAMGSLALRLMFRSTSI
jgi:hypothetical protein